MSHRQSTCVLRSPNPDTTTTTDDITKWGLDNLLVTAGVATGSEYVLPDARGTIGVSDLVGLLPGQDLGPVQVWVPSTGTPIALPCVVELLALIPQVHHIIVSQGL